MKGPETFRSLSERNLLYLCEEPRDLQKPLGKDLLYLYEGRRDRSLSERY